MRGVGVIEFGGPEVLQVVDLAEAHARPSEVRIKVYAATVNSTGSGLRSGDKSMLLERGVLKSDNKYYLSTSLADADIEQTIGAWREAIPLLT